MNHDDVRESVDDLAIITISWRDRNLHGGYIGLVFDVHVTLASDGGFIAGRTGLSYLQAVACADAYEHSDWSAYADET